MGDAGLDKDQLVGWFYIVLVPIFFIAFAVWYLLINQPLMIVILAVLGFIYIAFLSDKVSYGSEQIKKVQIPNAPETVEKLLKTTSFRGELVFVYLISAFDNGEKLSQTDLVSRIKKRQKITMTHQAICRYIVRLEERDLIHSPTHTREYQYALTEQGKWCSKAVKVCFPQTTVGYIVRHFLKFRKLPQYPSVKSQSMQTERGTTQNAAESSN